MSTVRGSGDKAPRRAGLEGQQMASTVTGKKRKKKKKDEGISDEGTAIFSSESQQSKQLHVATVVANGPAVETFPMSEEVLKRDVLDEICSSSSSVENSKPQTKIGRFDYSSSDAVSTGPTSSSTAMDVSQTSSPITLVPAVHTSNIPTNCSNLTVSSNNSTYVSNSTSTTAYVSTSSGSKEHTVPSLLVESLRWENECSDEEQERRRIELYKENRRKRYENALQERRAQIAKKNPYYAPSETISHS